MLRPAGVPTPCGSCEKVPLSARVAGADVRDLRKLAADLTPANRRAWEFYRRCRAVGRFPEDPLVEWYAGILRDVEDLAARRPLADLAAGLGLLAAALKR